MTDSYVPANLLWTFVTFVPLSAIVITFLMTKNPVDLTISSLVVSLAMPLNGVITDIIKLVVGRPRPDFAHRCWPDSGGVAPPEAFSGGGGAEELHCSGNPDIITEGRKSFPSGHSSFSFCSWGFVFLYLSGSYIGVKFKCDVHLRQQHTFSTSPTTFITFNIFAIFR